MRLQVPVLVSVLLVPVLSPALCPPALAASAGLELSELLVDPAPPQTDANDEFVEFHNAGTVPVALANYKIKVGSSATLHTLPAQTLAPGGFVALTSATSPWALANTGGQISLIDASGATIDSTTWPAAITGAAWVKSLGGMWAWTGMPTPGSANQITAVSGAASGGATSGPYAELELNELLPDPASPLTDANDEYIELFNPNPDPVNVEGYIIKTGASLATKHTLKSAVVPPAGYLALKSADTKVALANGGSSVALFDPAGTQLGATIIYGKAKTGASWARFDDHWSWTADPTPGSSNILDEAPLVASASSKNSSKTSASKAKPAKSKAATAKAKSKAKAQTKSTAVKATAASSPSGTWLLLALVGLTMAYVAYEFRQDLLNFYHRFRRHAGRRGQALDAPQGRGSD